MNGLGMGFGGCAGERGTLDLLRTKSHRMYVTSKLEDLS